MQSKSLLVAIAAFAVRTTGVQAFHGTAVLDRADITTEQRTALEEAHELRQAGDKSSARDLLVEAGVDETVLQSLREAARELRLEVKEAVANGDYDLFLTLIEDTPLADIITTEADFELFQEAQELREGGDKDAAREILDELGFDPREHHGKHRGHRIGSQLTDDQREAIRVAKEANDRDTVRAILEEAGVERR